MKEDEKKFYDLLQKANEANSLANEYEKKSIEQRSLYRKLNNEAAEMIVPFKVGDVIEYKDTIGWRTKKEVNLRMRVISFSIGNERVGVRGFQVAKNGNENHVEKYFSISEKENPFIQIIEEKK